MRRRALLAGAAGATALAGCSVLPATPDLQRRDWPILLSRPPALPPRPGAPVLLVREIRPAPGLDRRGVMTMQPDGSLRVDFYEEWAVAPAEGVQNALGEWLGGSGLFSAVIASGSTLTPDLVLEGDLNRFWGDPAAGHADVALAVVVVDRRRGGTHVRLQQTFAATPPLGSADAPAVTHAILAALADVLGQLTQALSGVV